MTNYIGIDLGGTSAKGALLDESGILGEVQTIPTQKEKTPEQTAEDIACLAETIRTKSAVKDIAGIGVGSPGIVDSKSGTVVHWTTFGWKNVALAKILKDKTGLPIKLLNDANAAVLGEYEYGAAKKYTSAVMLTLGTSVGSGIVINGKIFVGNKGAGGEIGHEVIRYNGEKCACGRRGCLERYASASALVRQAQKAMTKNRDSVLWQECIGAPNTLTGIHIFDAVNRKDSTAETVLKKYTDYVAEGVINAINVFHPEAVIIGGGISAQDELLIQPLKERVQKYVSEYAPVEIVAAKLGNNAGIYGAAAFAKNGELL